MPWRTREKITVISAGKLVWGHSGFLAMLLAIGIFEPKTVRQGHVACTHALGDFDGHDRFTAAGGESSRLAGLQIQIGSIFRTDAERAGKILLAPFRIAINGVGSERAPFASRENQGELLRCHLRDVLIQALQFSKQFWDGQLDFAARGPNPLDAFVIVILAEGQARWTTDDFVEQVLALQRAESADAGAFD